MKTLRLFRNIAVLFILLMALLASRPEPVAAHATGKTCGNKRGWNCSTVSPGKCQESPCNKTGFCLDIGCV
jgi:hypothetical protein